ncbi:hypothetical protein EDF57_11411 [Novosphingobium sp. PhB55]|nr:hypothetical protein EDF57_11411 [Novosphingobium sp. PhB55]
MIGELGNDNVGEQARTSAATRHGERRRWCLTDRIAAVAGKLGSNVTDDAEAAGDIFQHFDHVLAELAHRAPTGGTAVGIRRCVHNLIATKMVGQWCTARLARGSLGRRIFGRMPLDHTLGMGMLGLEILQRQFELIGLERKSLRGPAKLHAPEAGQLDLELLDLQRRQLDRVLGVLELPSGLVMGRPFGLQRLLRSRQTCAHRLGKSAVLQDRQGVRDRWETRFPIAESALLPKQKARKCGDCRVKPAPADGADRGLRCAANPWLRSATRTAPGSARRRPR